MEVLGTTMAQNLLTHDSYIQVEIIQECSSLSLILSYLKPLIIIIHYKWIIQVTKQMDSIQTYVEALIIQFLYKL